MVAKLVSAANEEASHKAFCDEELSKSSASRDEKTMGMDDYSARLEAAKSGMAELDEQVKTLQSEIADIDKAQKEAAAVREEEKANYLKTSSDYKQSAEAVSNAIEVLKEYYEGALIQTSSSARRTSLIAAGRKSDRAVTAARQPAFGGAKSDAGSSIISILEMAEADFTKLLAQSETAENQAVEAFRKLADEDAVAKAAKLASVKGKISEVKSLEVAMNNYQSDYDTVSKEYDAVIDYLSKLKPQCQVKAMSYEEKKALREAEIEGLKEALAVLDGEGIALVETTHRSLSLRRA
jgi:hypothetical protein